MIFKVLT